MRIETRHIPERDDTIHKWLKCADRLNLGVDDLIAAYVSLADVGVSLEEDIGQDASCYH